MHFSLPQATDQAVLLVGQVSGLSWSIVRQTGQRLYEQPAGPDISLLAPRLQQQWDHAANVHLGGIIMKPYSIKKVGWVCDQCPDGHQHQWEARINNRSRGSGCPQCVGRKLCRHNSLATKAPGVAKHWNYSKNSLRPDTIVANSHMEIEWKCDVCGHEWTTTPNSRVQRNAGCAQCNAGGVLLADGTKPHIKHPTFAESKHFLLAEWDYTRNEAQGTLPSNTTLSSSKKVYWLCQRCPAGQVHSWCASPNNRLSKSRHVRVGCPMCTGRLPCKCNSLQTHFPAVAAQWDCGKNVGTPNDYTMSSHYLAWWVSSERGSWQQTINDRTCGSKQAAKMARSRQQMWEDRAC